MGELEGHFIHQFAELHGKLAHLGMVDAAEFAHGKAPEAIEQLSFCLL